MYASWDVIMMMMFFELLYFYLPKPSQQLLFYSVQRETILLINGEPLGGNLGLNYYISPLCYFTLSNTSLWVEKGLLKRKHTCSFLTWSISHLVPKIFWVLKNANEIPTVIMMPSTPLFHYRRKIYGNNLGKLIAALLIRMLHCNVHCYCLIYFSFGEVYLVCVE